MKRLLTLMLACAAILVMGITAAAVSANGGSDGPSAAQVAQPCDERDGDNNQADDGEANDSRAVVSDTSEGTSGDDSHQGTSGDDRFSGQAGNDDERGGAGDDDLEGGSGADHLNGGRGKDDINGGAGNDVITSRDGQRDVVTCGRGTDRVRADREDRVSSTCESVSRR